ncbi:MAG: hypothetical protein CMM01_20005 [Rhodopirellula sp.]|nr:hypothetical protein [Rhodopirellula sp.]
MPRAKVIGSHRTIQIEGLTGAVFVGKMWHGGTFVDVGKNALTMSGRNGTKRPIALTAIDTLLWKHR